MPSFPVLYEVHFKRGGCVAGLTKELAHDNARQHLARAERLKLADPIVREGWSDVLKQPTAGNPPANA